MLEAAVSVSALQARHVRARFECPGTLPSQIEREREREREREKQGKRKIVAERTSYFYLVRNLIRPLGSTHIGGARGVIVIVEKNGHGDMGSYPERD